MLTSVEAIKKQLKTSEPLSPRARLLWERVVGEGEQPSRRRLWKPATAGLAVAAGVLLIILGTVLWQNKMPLPHDMLGGQPKTDVARSANPPFKDPAKGLSLLAADVDQLEAELRKLERDAEKKAAQQQIALMLDQFGRQ